MGNAIPGKKKRRKKRRKKGKKHNSTKDGKESAKPRRRKKRNPKKTPTSPGKSDPPPESPPDIALDESLVEVEEKALDHNPLMGRDEGTASGATEEEVESQILHIPAKEHENKLHALHSASQEDALRTPSRTVISNSNSNILEEPTYEYQVDDHISITFQPGTLGFAYTPEMVVDALQNGGQAHRNQVQIGYKIEKLNGQVYNFLGLEKAIKNIREENLAGALILTLTLAMHQA